MTSICTDAKEKSLMPKVKAENDMRHPADKFPPLDIDQEPEKLFHDICERLREVFDKYGCEATPEGWQQLARELMLTYEPAIRTVNSMQRMTDEPNFYALAAMHRKRKAEPRRAIADIAREIAKDFGKKAETLESRYSSEDKDRLYKRNLSEALTRHVSRRLAFPLEQAMNPESRRPYGRGVWYPSFSDNDILGLAARTIRRSLQSISGACSSFGTQSAADGVNSETCIEAYSGFAFCRAESDCGLPDVTHSNCTAWNEPVSDIGSGEELTAETSSQSRVSLRQAILLKEPAA